MRHTRFMIMMPPLMAMLMIAGLLMFQEVRPEGSPDKAGASSAAEERIKRAFSAKGNSEAVKHDMIGRLGILLLKPGGSDMVRTDHIFHADDQFRFEITPSQNGWLFILHVSPSGELSQLWPQKNSSNEIRSGSTYIIPPHPGAFRFDRNTGQEEFYLAIRSDPAPPKLGKPEGKEDQTKIMPEAVRPAGKPSEGIMNFRIKDPFGGGIGRGVVFDPGTANADTHIYFYAPLEDGSTSAAIMFKLQHK